MKQFFVPSIACPLLASLLLVSCKQDDDKNEPPATGIELKTYSVTPSLVKTLAGFDGLKIYPLISSDDKLANSPNFIYGAQPDGAGLIKNENGEGYILINNHEILCSVSRVFLDKNLQPVKGEYIVDKVGGLEKRLCSASMATQEEHGFGPLFLTAGESGSESMIHAIDPVAAADPKANRTLAALGKCSAENAVPMPKTAYAGKTLIFIGEDDTPGQVNLYLSNTVGDVKTGKLYMLRRTDLKTAETDMQVGTTYDVEFVEYDNVTTSTGVQLAAQTVDKKAIQFARVEDLDYGKGSADNNRKLYFTATGISQSDKLTPVAGYNMWGRVYRLEMDAANPLKGKLTPLIDGNENPGNSIVNPDNICVTQNFVYIQEDGDSYYKENKHDGRIWQYSLATKSLKPMIEMNHRRTDATFNAKYNPSNDQRLSSWEFGAMYDISALIGKPNTFVVNIHPHTWRDDKFKNADGSGLNLDPASGHTEGGQTIIISGIEK